VENAKLFLTVAGRSPNGCWTCRLRKKKCDEKRPSCSTCTSLELDCDGYGPRPMWMDRGVLEREQALLVKGVVTQARLRRRHQDLRPEPYPLPLGTANWLNPSLSVPTQGGPSVQGGPEPQCYLLPSIGEGDLSTFNEPLWSESFYSASLPAESLFSQACQTAYLLPTPMKSALGLILLWQSKIEIRNRVLYYQSLQRRLLCQHLSRRP
jgi:hypothetical protein